MNKEEILAKSRLENKDQDIYEKEVLKDAGNISAFTVMIICLIYFFIQLFLGGGINYGMWSIVFSMNAAMFTVKAIRFRKKHETIIAVMDIIVSLLMIAAHIYNLFTSSIIL